MKPNQNARQNQNRQGRPNHNNQKRTNKGRPNQPRNQQGRNQQNNSPNRQMESRGPGGSLRGNAKQLYEKYKVLAQEKRASDRLESESLAQYADHYYRMYAESAATEAAAQVAREEERAKKAQADAERRANAAPDEQQQNIKPEKNHPHTEDDVKMGSNQPPEKNAGPSNTAPTQKKGKETSSEAAQPETNNAEDQRPVEEKTTTKKPDALTLDLGEPAVEAPKKRRGRPAKVKTEEKPAENAEDAAAIPAKKVIRKPRKKIIVPPQESQEGESAE